MPMRLDEGWNQIQFNLADFTRRAYGTNYVETLRIQIHANCRIRRIYFSDRLYSEDELPAEFKLYLPVQAKAKAWKVFSFFLMLYDYNFFKTPVGIFLNFLHFLKPMIIRFCNSEVTFKKSVDSNWSSNNFIYWIAIIIKIV